MCITLDKMHISSKLKFKLTLSINLTGKNHFTSTYRYFIPSLILPCFNRPAAADMIVTSTFHLHIKLIMKQKQSLDLITLIFLISRIKQKKNDIFKTVSCV